MDEASFYNLKTKHMNTDIQIEGLVSSQNCINSRPHSSNEQFPKEKRHIEITNQ